MEDDLYTGILRVTLEQIKERNFKPEKHTVAFLDDADEWYGYIVGGKIRSVLGVSNRHGGKYIQSCYTEPEYRRRGLLCSLISYVCDLYNDDNKMIVHCLASSKGAFEACGFEHYRTVYFKHGTQWFMKKEAKNAGRKETET